MGAKFLDHNNMELSNDDGNGNKNGKKAIDLYQQKSNNNNNSSRLLEHFVARLQHETYLFHAPALRSWWTQRENVLFLFRNLDTGLWDSTPEKFDNIWQIKWNWIRSVKIETLWIHFLSELSVCCHPEILPPCQRDKTTSRLYSGLEMISRESPDTMTGQIHFSSVTCRFWPVKFVR